MSGDAVIAASDISLAYKVYNKPADLLVEGVFGGVRHDTFWALRNVTLNVREGQRLGIVGPNGAGKSTLLQIIAGNLTPTSGAVRVNGKLSSLLSRYEEPEGEPASDPAGATPPEESSDSESPTLARHLAKLHKVFAVRDTSS